MINAKGLCLITGNKDQIISKMDTLQLPTPHPSHSAVAPPFQLICIKLIKQAPDVCEYGYRLCHLFLRCPLTRQRIQLSIIRFECGSYHLLSRSIPRFNWCVYWHIITSVNHNNASKLIPIVSISINTIRQIFPTNSVVNVSTQICNNSNGDFSRDPEFGGSTSRYASLSIYLTLPSLWHEYLEERQSLSARQSLIRRLNVILIRDTLDLLTSQLGIHWIRGTMTYPWSVNIKHKLIFNSINIDDLCFGFIKYFLFIIPLPKTYAFVSLSRISDFWHIFILLYRNSSPCCHIFANGI